MEGVDITEIERNGSDGWEWVMTFDDPCGDHDGLTTQGRYKTNEEGEGLFFFSGVSAGWRQLKGTLQFNLRRATTERAVRAAIIRQWTREGG